MNIKVYRYYLEIKDIKKLKESIKPNENCIIKLVDPADFQLNKFFYKQIGKNYGWKDRLIWSDEKWINYAKNSNLKTYVLYDLNDAIGYYETIFYNNNECEIAYLGVFEEHIGKKYGGYLLTEAIKKSFIKNTIRVWVHTCSLDHINALNNYKSRGMSIFKEEQIEINSN